LATLKCEAARDDIVAAMRQRLLSDEPHKNAWRIPEVEVLASFDEQGRDSLFDVTTTEHNLQFRVESYNALARQRYEKVLRPMADVLQELVQNGLWDPRVERHMHNERSQAYRFLVTMLAEGLIALDPNRAYPLIASACLEVDDEDTRNQLA
jgi:hypothetical protein